MSKDTDLEGAPGEADVFGANQEPPLLSDGMSPDGQYVGPLEIRDWEFSEIVDTNSSIIFNVPQSDGEHQVWIDYYGPNGYHVKLLEGAWYWGQQWNECRATGLPEGYGEYSTIWRYKTDWSETRNKPVFVRKLPVITGKDELTATVLGTGVTSGYLDIVQDSTNLSMSPAILGNQANWTLKVREGLKPWTYSIRVRHSETGWATRYSKPISFNYYGVPTIREPKQDDVVRESRPRVEGQGFPSATVKIYQSGSGAITYGEAQVGDDGVWSTYLQHDLPYGSFTFIAQQSMGNSVLPGWSNLVTVNAKFPPGTPAIDSLLPVTEQNQSFTLTGSNGGVGGIVRIFIDGTSTQVGESAVLTQANWRALVQVPVGRVSLVAINVRDEYESGRSGPRAFKIRPPALLEPQMTVLADGGIRFSGSGHSSATVEFTLLSDSGVTVPPSVVVRDGIWQTTATGWPFGTYKLKVIQKVQDGANGWIESVKLEFTVDKHMPDVYETDFSREYQPTFSGKGYNGATVRLYHPGGIHLAAPDVVVKGGEWSSRAIEQWGPTDKREVHIKQFIGEAWSPTWVALKVTIPPRAPGLDDPPEDGLLPMFSGTCWPGADVNIRFSDEEHVVYPGIVSDGTWQFRRDKAFAADVAHTVTVTQFVDEQPSDPASKSFTVHLPMLVPVITQPEGDAKVGRVTTVAGENGMQGATLQLRDFLSETPLGAPKELDEDGNWSIVLSDLAFRRYTIDARQTLAGRHSAYSDRRSFEVVLQPPLITQPTMNGKLPRTAMLEGTGMANAQVEVFLQGLSEPWLKDVAVNQEGYWKAEVTLPVGHKTIWARQWFTDDTGKRRESDNTEPVNYQVVPAAPFIETPVEGDVIGRWVVVSGFGVPGDTVSVTLAGAARAVLASAIVQDDRTWSVASDVGSLTGGHYRLQAVASLQEFESVEALRPVMLGTFLPSLERPAAGKWVSQPVQFSGRSREGMGVAVSWYNPDVQWVAQLPVTGGQWDAEATQTLPEAGHWYRFRQTLTDGADDATMSDWVDSARFEVESARPLRKDS
ncbi:hypothetical protein [Pseudomonas monsensis]|uniref:hypothetical protein n=1 Tax=Pseudomonas monsensis TaxID=2745509 RepID=UPI003D20838D